MHLAHAIIDDDSQWIAWHLSNRADAQVNLSLLGLLLQQTINEHALVDDEVARLPPEQDVDPLLQVSFHVWIED